MKTHTQSSSLPRNSIIDSRKSDDTATNRRIPAAWLGVASALLLTSRASAGLVNPGFEVPVLTPGVPDFFLVNEAVVTGWETSAPDNLIEIWSDNFTGGDGFGPIPSFEGNQHAELNANSVATLFQEAAGVAPGSRLDFRFAHRGRLGVDTLRLTIMDLGVDNVLGGGNDTTLFTKDYSTDRFAWAQYTSGSELPIIALGNKMRFSYESVSAAGGNPTYGNFLDDADFGVGVAIPEPTTGLAGLACALVVILKRRRKEPASIA